MSSTPKQFRELITRDIIGFMLVGGIILLAFAAGQDSLLQLAKQFASKHIATSTGEDLLANQQTAKNLAASNKQSPAVGWKFLTDSAIPFSLNVPTNTESVAPACSIKLGEAPLQWIAYHGTGLWKQGDLEMGELELTVQWGQAAAPLSREEQRRFLRQEPSRLLIDQGLQPRVGLSAGQTWKEGSLYGFQITAELNDGRKVATRYDLNTDGVLQVQAVFREKPQQPWPVEELFRSLRIQPTTVPQRDLSIR